MTDSEDEPEYSDKEESDGEDSSEYEADPPDLDSRKVDVPLFFPLTFFIIMPGRGL